MSTGSDALTVGSPARRVLVMGASGKTGRAVTSALVTRGFCVRAAVRSPTSAEAVYAALRAGAAKMQLQTVGSHGQQLPGDLISIIQALVIIFVAADQVLRWLYRMRQGQGEAVVLSRGWGKAE